MIRLAWLTPSTSDVLVTSMFNRGTIGYEQVAAMGEAINVPKASVSNFSQILLVTTVM